MVGQAECYSAFTRWFETKAWHTEESTIAVVLEGFLKRKVSAESDDFKNRGPFTKTLLKRVTQKIGPIFKIQLCGKMTLEQLTQTLNRHAYDMSLSIFGRAYHSLPTEEHRLFIIENLDLAPEDAKFLLANNVYLTIRHIQNEICVSRSIPDLEQDLSRDQFNNEADFWLHLYCLKKLYEKLKESVITLSHLPLKSVYIDYTQADELIQLAQENSSELLNLRKRTVKSNLLILPPRIGQLTQLTALFLDHNRLAYLPIEVGNLDHLRRFSIQDNGLTYLPHAFQNLTNLTHLCLRDNLLSDIPKWFKKLTNLQLLDLSVNSLSTVPQAIRALGALSRLSLSGNPLTSVSLNADGMPKLAYLGLKAIHVTPIENREITLLKERKCKVVGAQVEPLLKALPQHLLLLVMTFLPWQGLHVIAGLNKYLNRYAKSLIERRESISQHVFVSSFKDIEEGERNFLTRHLCLTQVEISIEIMHILQQIERICSMIQDDIAKYVELDEDGIQIKRDLYSIEDIKEWLSYNFFDNQEAFLNHLYRLRRSIKHINKTIQLNNQQLSLESAFHSYEHCLYEILETRKNNKHFSYINSALVLLPPEFSRFKHLEKITLIELYLTSLPDDLKNLAHLRHIYLNKNAFTEIPDVLFSCPHLKSIALIDNFISVIPERIAVLQSLEMLALQKNNITEVPDALSELPHLKSLILTENPILTLPSSITKLTSLMDLRVDLKWSALRTKQQLWVLRQKQQNMKTTGIPVPHYLMQIPAILESIQTSLQETHGFKPLEKIEASFSPDSFDEDLGAFLDYLQQFANSVILSNQRIANKKKHQINPTELSFSYKGYKGCLKMIESSAREKSAHFRVKNTFNTLTTLTFLPLNIRALEHVKHINLQRNRLTYIHKDIWKLPFLETLKLDWNQLTELPDGINQSTHLKVLSLSHNPLYKLPNGIERTRLKKLELGHTIIAWKSLPRTQKRWLRKSINAGIATGLSFKK